MKKGITFGCMLGLFFAMTFLLSFCTGQAFGGLIILGGITAPSLGGISGIAFDDALPGDPLIGTGSNGSILQRLNPHNAAILSTSSLPSNFARSLTYAGNGKYYETGSQPDALFSVNPSAGTVSKIGTSLIGSNFNFLDMAYNPIDGTLWAVSDNNGGSLYRVNQTTGVATLSRTLTGIPGQAVSLAIDPLGNFFVSNASGAAFTNDQIFRVDPVGTSVIPIATVGYPAPNFLDDFAWDPSTNQWFGILEMRSATPRAWYLVQITGIPEPSGYGTCIAALFVLTIYRMKPKLRT